MKVDLKPSVRPRDRASNALESVVLDSQALTPTVRAVRISKPPGFTFKVSQAVRLILPAAGGESRLLSIASAPTRDYLEFAARISSSRFKRAFAALQPGDPVAISTPKGHFPFADDRPAILVAAGVGITPLKSMAEYANDLKLKTPIVLLYGNRSPDEIAFRAQLDELQAANPYFRIVYTVSQSDRTWPGRVGRITPNLLE
ncbi:MAG: ferredoxin--NADP reductase, partial [Candidatus Methylomirabilales bacterium]